VTSRGFDVAVIGSGPAGSVAALVLARGGARVALVDKAAFPRQKACGDLIGPRGTQLLSDLTIDIPHPTRVSDMVVVGPTGNRVRLPARAGRTYPGHGIVVQRSHFDALLQRAALDAGAELLEGRAEEPIGEDDRLCGFSLSSDARPSSRVSADVIIGADGATSRVAEVAGLVDPGRVLWGFAVRTYLDQPVDLPHIMFWTPRPRAGFNGYGWVFPAGDEQANVGLGVGVLGDRSDGRRAVRDLDAFLDHAASVGVLTGRGSVASLERPLGAWLKMGLVGTKPAHDRVLLVGDAAGLVNPLQGEGIAQAMESGRAAAVSVLAGVHRAPATYRSYLARAHAPYLATAATVQRSLVTRPGVTAALTRILTAPAVGAALAGGWAIAWNDLLEGAVPSLGARVAAGAARLGHVLTARSADRQWITEHIGGTQPVADT
jgi:geranylgeranyl reductase family protein